MKSSINTVDALTTEARSFKKRDKDFNDISGIVISKIGFTDVKFRDIPSKSISKIINPNSLIYESNK